ncbi:MAG: hypothetical protein F4X99_24420, partial [Gammaproteobacteria bacterium]|nr:hypothetical protein [Gammaproteobacteria bacterium]
MEGRVLRPARRAAEDARRERLREIRRPLLARGGDVHGQPPDGQEHRAHLERLRLRRRGDARRIPADRPETRALSARPRILAIAVAAVVLAAAIPAAGAAAVLGSFRDLDNATREHHRISMRLGVPLAVVVVRTDRGPLYRIVSTDAPDEAAARALVARGRGAGGPGAGGGGGAPG